MSRGAVPALACLALLAACAIAVRADEAAPAVALASLAAIALGFTAWERGPGGAREVALVASLGAAAAAGRVLFAPVPSVKPVSFITACTGVALGPRAGAATGALSVLISNGFLGHGPWTPWQMLGWGLIGATAGWIGPVLRNRWALAAFGCFWGFAYGALLTASSLAATGPTFTWAAFTASWVRGLPFDTAHAVTNVVLALAAGPALIRMLDRFGRRLHADVEQDEPAAVSAGASA